MPIPEVSTEPIQLIVDERTEGCLAETGFVPGDDRFFGHGLRDRSVDAFF
jgi:hypothetical protein